MSLQVLEHLDTVREDKSAEELLEECEDIADLEERVAFFEPLLANFKLPLDTNLDNKKQPGQVEEKFFKRAK